MSIVQCIKALEAIDEIAEPTTITQFVSATDSLENIIEYDCFIDPSISEQVSKCCCMHIREALDLIGDDGVPAIHIRYEWQELVFAVTIIILSKALELKYIEQLRESGNTIQHAISLITA